MVEISVADTGPGLAPEVRANLFRPFVTTKDSGMGVGLSVCRSIVEAHGGRLWAEDNPGGGTVFRFTLPRVPEAPLGHADVTPESLSTGPIEWVMARAGGSSILQRRNPEAGCFGPGRATRSGIMAAVRASVIAVVDDDDAVRESLAFLLTVSGHKVAAYASAADFLEHCDLCRVAGLIVDHHMPQADRARVARQVARGRPHACRSCSSPARRRRKLWLGPARWASIGCWRSRCPTKA